MISEKQNINMILGQIFTNNVNNIHILKAFANNPRHKFFEEQLSSCAYIDENIKISENCYQMSPLLCAQMLNCLNIKSSEKILEIGSGCGFNAAVISDLAYEVDSIGKDQRILAKAKEFLHDRLKENCHFYNEIPNKKYDGIFISGMVTSVNPYLSYLDNIGRGVAILGENTGSLGDLVIFTKNNQNVSYKFITRVTIYQLEN